MTNIQDFFEENKVNLKIENGNIFVILKIHKIGKGEDLISIELNKKSLSLQELNENLFKEVSELKNRVELLENKNHKNEINELKNKITSLDSKINELLNWKNTIEEKEKEKEILKSLINSKIITSKEELDFITNRLK